MRRWYAAARAGRAGVVVALVAAGCTGDGNVSPTTATATTTTTTTVPERTDDGVLKIGLLLPQSGDGATIGQPMIEAAGLARDGINAAGGVRGQPVEVVSADEGNSAATARDAITQLLDDGVDAVVGPASSTVALATLGELLTAGVLTCSPTATSLALDDFPNSELFFRTAPSDSLQAAAIAQLADQTGARTVGVTYLDDVYGRPLAEATMAALQSNGLTVVEEVAFAAYDESLVDEATAIGDSGAAAVVVIGDADQGVRMLTELSQIAGNLETPEPPEIIVNDAVRRPPSAQQVASLGAAVLDHLRGVSPRAAPQQPEEPPGLYATNAYDCVNLIALAAEVAAIDTPAVIPEPEVMAAVVPEVSTGGQPCQQFEECIQLLGDDRNIDYDGPGGGVEIGPDGDPVQARFDVFRFDAAGVDVSTGASVLGTT